MNRQYLQIGLLTTVLAVSSACGKGGLADLSQGGGMGNIPNPTVPSVEVDRIEVSPATLSLVEDASVSIEVVGFKSDGTDVVLTEGLVWTSANEAVATVNDEGLVAAAGPGDTTVEVSYGMLKAVVQVSVSDAKLVDLSISPEDVSTAIGGVTQFQAFGTLDDSSKIDLTAVVSWKSSDPTVADVDASGLSTAIAGGEVTISASFSGQNAEAFLKVSEAKIASLRIDPDEVTLAPASVQQFTVTAFLDDGTQADLTASAQWASSDNSLVSVVAGLATAQQPGNVEIIATLGDLTASAKVVVTAYRLVSVRIEPNPVVLELGDEQPLKAIGVYENQDEVDLTATAQWTSNNDRVVSVSNAPGQQGKISAISPGTVTIKAEVGSLAGEVEVEVSEARLVSLEFGANSLSIREGATEQVQVFGNYSDMTRRDVTDQVNWTSDNTQVATVSNSGSNKGEVQAIAQGMANIEVALDGVTASIMVSVTPPGLIEIEVSPANQMIEEETRLNYTAEGIYSNGNRADITTDVTWSVADPNIALISNLENTEGLLLSQNDGTTQVRASFDGITGETNLTVVPPALTQIQITPVNPTFNVGDFTGLGATAVYSNGTTRNISRDAQWTTSDQMVVEVNSGGRMGSWAEMVGPGTAIITATFQGQSASSTFTINSAAVVSLTIDPVIWTAPIGDVRRFTAQAIYSDGSSSEVSWMTDWTTNDANVASVGNNRMDRGVVRANSAGMAQITATYQGLQATANVTITPAVITSIQVTPFMPTMTIGRSQQFQAVAIMSDGTTENITREASWISTDTAVAGVSNSRWNGGTVTAVAAGTTTIRATYFGATGETALSVSSASIDRIQITPFIPTIPVGYGAQMRATVIYTDGTTFDITGNSSWSVSNPALAAVSNANGSHGWMTTLSAGTTEIRAQYMGVVGTTDLTVTSASLTSITVTPDVATVAAGQTLNFQAMGNFDDGSMLEITWFVTWNSSDLTVADVSNAWWSWGQATGFGPGSASIIASRGTVTGNAMLTVQ